MVILIKRCEFLKLVRDHQTKLAARLAEIREEIKKLETRLANKSYLAKAPADLVAETKNQLTDKKELENHLLAELHAL